MLQIAFFREEESRNRILQGLLKRNFSEKKATEKIQAIVEADLERRTAQRQLDDTLAAINASSKSIGLLMAQGKKEEAEAQKQAVSVQKQQEEGLKTRLSQADETVKQLLLELPNCPNELVPFGKTPDDNFVYKMGEVPIPTLPENALPHWELMEKYDIVDLKLGVKITGAGFPVYKGKGAKLQRALINFFLDEATKAGYYEVQVPHVVNEASAYGTGQLPDKEGQMYYIPEDDLYMIPTAEVPITNLFRDRIIEEKDLPLKYCGYTPCFRREAGSYGAHVRGLNRLHQFDKIEIVQVQHPSKSYEALNAMVAHVESLLIKLELPYRILRLCGGDMGFASAMTYDFESYSTAQSRWLEVSSTSNFETFQSNRLALRYRDENQKTQLAHTLNGSALALPRIVASLLENNQTPEGIRIPEVLRPYTGFDFIS